MFICKANIINIKAYCFLVKNSFLKEPLLLNFGNTFLNWIVDFQRLGRDMCIVLIIKAGKVFAYINFRLHSNKRVSNAPKKLLY